MAFWDSSALVALLLEEATAKELKPILLVEANIEIWWATKVELASAVCRSHRMGEIPEQMLPILFKKIEQLTAQTNEIEPTPEIRNVAYRILRIHNLRAADALQLAAALVLADHNPSGESFVCLDNRLQQAALKEGFSVLPKLGND